MSLEIKKVSVTSIEETGGGSNIASTDISDATPAGRALLTAADAAAQRTALEIDQAIDARLAEGIVIDGGSL